MASRRTARLHPSHPDMIQSTVLRRPKRRSKNASCARMTQLAYCPRCAGPYNSDDQFCGPAGIASFQTRRSLSISPVAAIFVRSSRRAFRRPLRPISPEQQVAVLRHPARSASASVRTVVRCAEFTESSGVCVDRETVRCQMSGLSFLPSLVREYYNTRYLSPAATGVLSGLGI